MLLPTRVWVETGFVVKHPDGSETRYPPQCYAVMTEPWAKQLVEQRAGNFIEFDGDDHRYANCRHVLRPDEEAMLEEARRIDEQRRAEQEQAAANLAALEAEQARTQRAIDEKQRRLRAKYAALREQRGQTQHTTTEPGVSIETPSEACDG